MNQSSGNGQTGPSQEEISVCSKAAQESSTADDVSAQITLDLIARTAFKLQELRPAEASCNSERLHALGQEAIDLLFVWAHQLEAAKKTRTASERAAELVKHWQVEWEQKEEEERELAKVEAISRSTPVAFRKAGRQVAPKDRNAMWLKRILQVLADENQPNNLLYRTIARKAINEKAVPQDLIPILIDLLPICRESYNSWMYANKGKKGGLQRAANQAKKRSSAKQEVKVDPKRLGKEILTALKREEKASARQEK
jgi:hypothetical protein